MPKQWFVVRTKPRQEDYARKQLDWQGFEVYLPQTLGFVMHLRKKSWVKRPFFPCYLFLNLTPKERHWTTIAGTYGAIGAVIFGCHYLFQMKLSMP